MKLKMITAMALLMCILLTQASVGHCASEEGAALRMADLFKSFKMDPFDIWLRVPGAEEGSELWGNLDMFPMDASSDDHTEITADYWELYDTVMSMTLVGTEVEPSDAPDYELVFLLDNGTRDGSNRVEIKLYSELNIVSVSRIEDYGEYSLVGRYFVMERLALNTVFDNIARFLDEWLKL